MAILRLRPGFRTELLAIDRREPVGHRALAVAALGMGVPVLAGALTGRLEIGLTIGLGAVLLAGAPAQTADALSDRSRPLRAAGPALLAVAAAEAVAGGPFGDGAVILLASLAGLVSGYSRPLAGAAIRFGIYLVLCAGVLNDASAYRGTTVLVFGLGALWNIVLRELLFEPMPAPEDAAPAKRMPTPAQRRAHFRKTLRTLAGWQFPLRLAFGLGLASAVRHLWPQHHFYWILLTVALLTQRPVEHVPVKIVQRLLGTIVGVAIAGLMLASVSSHWMLAVFAGLLATAVPVARARSYLLYSIVATPLILLVLDLGKPIDATLLSDRLVATLVGGTIVVVANRVCDALLSRSAE